MSLIGLIVVVVVVGLIMWLVNEFLPLQEPYKRILNVVVIIAVVLYVIVWLLRFAGLGGI